jgi:tetratricopeptide (TPR) repeat protein
MVEPKRISDYQVVDVLGRGGMGVVYAAIHASGTHAAVKTVRVATESTLESIRREILMLRELEHPGVVGIRDHGVAPDGTPWYAMDLLHGRTLRDDFRFWFPEPALPDDSTRDLKAPGRTRARESDLYPVRASERSTPPYSLAHIATVFRKICEPLAYVHGQGVIHRDLSPGNIFLVGADEPVLFDFGLAAQFHPDGAREVLEVGGYARGTAHYMAPEQARGEVVDARADIYALGCILFEALTGRPPFLDDVKSVLMQHIEDPAPLVSRFAPAAAAFDEIVMRMLAKQPRDRLGYVEDVAAALVRVGASTGPARPRARAYTYRAGLAGRDDTLARFDDYVKRLITGAGGSAVLIGESGAGKTRLAGEIATRAAGADIRVITGECEPLAVGERGAIRAAPLHPLRPLLRAIAHRCREGGRAEADRLLGLDGGLLAAYEPALAGFATTTDRLGPNAIGAPAARFRVLSVLRDVLAAMTLNDPLWLVLDDLQWADELTLAFLGTLDAAFFARTGLFVLTTARSGEASPSLEATLAALGADRFLVPRLDRAAVAAMVRDMLALDEDAPTLADYVANRSEGNPLFAAEYLRIAVDDGKVERDPTGRWRLSQRDDDSYDNLPTPGSVQELGRRRLDQLSEVARELAVAAAVLGRSCDVEVLTATAAISADAARTGVAELIQRHVVHEADGQLRFDHDSLRELAYARLDVGPRRTLHRRAAFAVEARHRDDPGFGLRFAELAHHWEQAGDRERAADFLERAADHSLDTAAYGDARAMLERLVILAPEAPPARRGRWLRRLGEASYALGDVAGLARHTERALHELGQPLPSSRIRLAASVMAGLGQQLWTRTLGRRGRVQHDEPAIVEAALSSAQMTNHYFFNDDSLGLVGAALAAVNLAERGGDNLPIAAIYAQLGYAAGLARLGGVARTYFAQARATAASTNDAIGLVKTMCTEAAFAIGVGAWDDAEATSTQALAIARAIRNPQDAEDALTIAGHVDFATGRYEVSRARATELRVSAAGRANAHHEAWGVYTEGRAALYLGELDLAIERFDAAMIMLANQHDRASLILCGGMQASALVRRGDPRARAAADATAARIGGRTPPVFSITEGLVGLCDAYLELWRQTGDGSLAAPARAAIADLAKLARLLPIAGPSAANRAGIYHLLDGSRRRAARELRRGLAAAERLGMPYDQALARAGLSAVLTGGDAADHRDAAIRQFRMLGCAWHLEAMRRGGDRNVAFA